MPQFDLFDSNGNSILGASTYSEFKENLIKSACTKCRLSERRTNIVVDRGNPDSKILVVGEGPGETEDLQAKAFVGRAGKLLDEIMKSIDLDTNKDMLIANVVKCRPPENRAPLKDEVDTCIPFLHKQIDLVKPKIILMLGATALKHMCKEKKAFAMEDEAGKFFESTDYPGIKLMVLYHPAYLLYDPRKKKNMWEHVKFLKTKLNEISV
jgi:uracil-DNA glycosylase